ncbi:S8 family serine peptidase [Hymenobacter sp. GOD-10R]|uniref:S8 family serine peptidase n=1 Tax=Hymenobacter sp. GOD-10R TaxID=3093922 RepID=UPI002D79E446|nr:S8 family serine peptidase [Hymenobacter sp. GOD-10R]WRQ31235.1 S8 family serine peptidase [Hymenobacter sp. GOD-10R]
MRISTLLVSSGLLLEALAPTVGTAAPLSVRVEPTAVHKYLIYFKDKANSPYSTAQPQAYLSARAIARRTKQGIAVLSRDLPVNPSYVTQVKAVPGVQVWYTSRWFNAAVVSCDESVLAALNGLPFVRSSQVLNLTDTESGIIKEEVEENLAATTASVAAVPADYGNAYVQANMIGAVRAHDAGFRGEGIQIAVFDGGFPGVNTASPFAALRNENRIASVFNFVEKNTAVYTRSSHGTNTLSTMGANQTGLFIGTAPNATYRLLITEDTDTESPVEEANWLIAAEYADSAGVDVISSSLGYTTFDNTALSHTYADMNGRTTIVSRAASVAARVGMLVCNSAGNDGAGAWRYIGAPADADSIISVGSVTSTMVRSSFSSFGPTADGRIKPDLAALGTSAAVISATGTSVRSSGTSFSCPILAGMAADFWQANPRLTAQQVIFYLKRSGTQVNAPDNSLGFGIPDFVRAYNLANPNTPLATKNRASAQPQLAVYPNPSTDEALTLVLPTELQGKALFVRIYDGRGALVAEQQVRASAAASVILQTGTLSQGMYNCTVQATNAAPRAARFLKL